MTDAYGNNDEVTVDHILDAWPEAKPFQDLIQATDLESYAAVAREIALKVRGMKSTGSGQQPSTTTTPRLDNDEAIKTAAEKKDWGGWLSAAWDRQNERENGRG